MKREELLAKGYTEEQVTDLLNLFHKENSETKKLSEEVNSKNETIANLQHQIDEINKANMTEQEKLEQMKKETELNLANSKKIYNTAKVKEILAGYDVEDDLIQRLVSDDENSSINSANLFKNRLDTIISNTTKKVQDSISNIDVKPNPTNIKQESNQMTAEKFKEMSMTEQVMWKREHSEEYEQIFKR